MQLLPNSSCCQDINDDCAPQQVPGPEGPSGTNGTNGTDGENAYTLTTAAFTMPNEGDTVVVAVANSDWMVPSPSQDSIVFVQFAGYMQVASTPTSTSATLKNISAAASSLYPNNAAPGTNIPGSSRVSPGGIQGPAGSTPADALLAANNLSDVDNAATSRTNLGLGTAAVKAAGNANGNVPLVDDVAGLANGEALFATASGIESKTAAASRTALGLGSMATQSAAAVAITGGSITGITDLAVADGGTGASTAASARTNLGVTGSLWRYGVIGSLTGVDLNVATSDNAVTIASGRYILDKVTVENASINLTAATAGVFTAAGGGGTTLAADQALSALTASTKFTDLTLAAVAGTDVQTAGTVYFRVGTPQGAAATADVFFFGYILD